MKEKSFSKKIVLILVAFLLLTVTNVHGQIDSAATESTISTDTLVEKSSSDKKAKRVSDFKIYGGISASQILLEQSSFNSAYATGYLLGFAYRKGRFGYWEIGINYNNSVVSLEGVNILEDNVSIRQLEIPISAGINLLSATRRVLGLRLFGGLVPGYILKVTDNPFQLEKDNLNRFQLGGRLGVGVDVLFLFIEGGYQYGFIDVLNDQNSNLSQFDIRLGFRF